MKYLCFSKLSKVISTSRSIQLHDNISTKNHLIQLTSLGFYIQLYAMHIALWHRKKECHFFLRVTNWHSQRCRKKTRSREKQFSLSSVLTCSEVFSNLNESMILSLGSHILLLNCKDVLAPLWQHDTFLTLASYAPYLWGCRQREGIWQPHSRSPIPSPEMHSWWSKVRDLISHGWWTCNDTIGILNFIHEGI